MPCDQATATVRVRRPVIVSGQAFRLCSAGMPKQWNVGGGIP
jgi:hypothetical protein